MNVEWTIFPIFLLAIKKCLRPAHLDFVKIHIQIVYTTPFAVNSDTEEQNGGFKSVTSDEENPRKRLLSSEVYHG